jgi:hypothetical protein
MVDTKRDRRVLNADETEQVLALLQEYDLGEGVANVEDEKENEEQRRRQFSSGAASSKVSSGGIISLPESAQRSNKLSFILFSFIFVQRPEALQFRKLLVHLVLIL